VRWRRPVLWRTCCEGKDGDLRASQTSCGQCRCRRYNHRLAILSSGHCHPRPLLHLHTTAFSIPSYLHYPLFHLLSSFLCPPVSLRYLGCSSGLFHSSRRCLLARPLGPMEVLRWGSCWRRRVSLVGTKGAVGG
jgi:hypothetical protein